MVLHETSILDLLQYTENKKNTHHIILKFIKSDYQQTYSKNKIDKKSQLRWFP